MLLLASSVCSLFKWRQFEPEIILMAMGWYLRFCASRFRTATSRSYWPSVDSRWITSPSGAGSSGTPRSWIGACANGSRQRTTRGYLYRAVDSSGATIDFLLSAKRDAAAAERFLTKALGGENHAAPRVINTDKHAAYPPAIVELKADGVLDENSKHRPVQYLNNILEQDHRAIKRRVRASQHFRSFWGLAYDRRL